MLENFYIYVGQNSGTGLLFGPGDTDEISVWGGKIDNVFVQSNSLTNPAVNLINFFDLNVPRLIAANNNNHAIVLENKSDTVNYGNSNFGFIRAMASLKAPFAGLFLKSSNPNHVINLMTFQNYECSEGYCGIYSMGSTHNVFQFVDIEGVMKPIVFDGSDANGDTRYTKIKGGYILPAANGLAITNTKFTAGNKFEAYVEDDFNKGMINDQSLYKIPNGYELECYGKNVDVTILNSGTACNIQKVTGDYTGRR